MVAQHYRWDFIGLSTDTKPTPENSEKVVDGSTYYESDTSKLYVFCDTNWYERKPLGGGGGGTTYTAGDGIKIADDTISVDTTTIQPKLTAGSNISISDNTISATDTTYSNFTGTDGTAAGSAGLVPAPATTDAGKFLKADGTWDVQSGGGPNVVQTTGTSTTDVMSQNATTGMIFSDPDIKRKISIGLVNTNSGNNTVAIGAMTKTTEGEAIAIGSTNNGFTTASGASSIAIGAKSTASGNGSIALGAYASATVRGQFDIGTSANTYGYELSNYRLLTGVYDGQSAHDAATKGQLDNLITMTTTDPGEGASLAANQFIAVYDAS